MAISNSMEKQGFTDLLSALNTIESTLNSAGHLVIEVPPDSKAKSSAINYIFEYTQKNLLNKFIICTSHLDSLSKISNSLIKPSNLLGIILSVPLPYCSNMTSSLSSPLSPESKCAQLCNTQIDFSSISGIFAIADVLAYASHANICPYFFTCKLLIEAKVVICTQSYFFRKGWDVDLLKKSVIVFEDAVNLDTTIINANSCSLNLKVLTEALRGIEEILAKMQEEQGLESFCEMCKNGRLGELVSNDGLGYNTELIDEMIPGNIRKPQYFIKYVKTAVVYLRQYLRTKEPNVQSAYGFLYKIASSLMVGKETLQFFSILLNALVNALAVKKTENIKSLALVCDFCSSFSLHPESYAMVYEPYPTSAKALSPVLQLACNDSSKFLPKVLQNLHSGFFFTSSSTPSEISLKILGLNCPVISQSALSTFCPLILTRGSDQLFVSTKFEEKNDDGVMRNYGELLLELSDVVPDGIVGFFPEWSVLEKYVMKWNESGIIYRLLELKIVLIETPGKEAQIMLNFQKACMSGRGAVLLAVSRGKIANDLHMYGELVKCSVIFGVPQPNILSRVLKARLCYYREKMEIEESEYLNWDAMRQAVYCATHGLRGGSKHSVMILADKRYDSLPKKNKLPQWISEGIKFNYSVSTDSAKTLSLKFLKSANGTS